MKIFNLKSLMAGFLIGAVCTTAVSVFAEATLGTVGSLVNASGKVEAWIQTKHVNMIVDGEYVTVPEDMDILNVDNRIYTPARLVAESLGASVDWEEARQAIIINGPEPEIIERDKDDDNDKDNDKDDEKDNDRRKRPNYQYSPLPLRIDRKDVSINIVDVHFFNDTTAIEFDLRNNTQYPLMFDKDNVYLEADGEKFPYDFGGADLFNNTTEEWSKDEGIILEFRAIPEDCEEFTLSMPVWLYDRFTYEKNYSTLNFVFNIDASEQRNDPYQDDFEKNPYYRD